MDGRQRALIYARERGQACVIVVIGVLSFKC
jgi:hypothetical protein